MKSLIGTFLAVPAGRARLSWLTARSVERGQDGLDPLPVLLVEGRQLEGGAERLEALVDGKARIVGGDLEDDAAGLPEIDGAEIVALLLFRRGDAELLAQRLRHLRLVRVACSPEGD